MSNSSKPLTAVDNGLLGPRVPTLFRTLIEARLALVLAKISHPLADIAPRSGYYSTRSDGARRPPTIVVRDETCSGLEG